MLGWWDSLQRIERITIVGIFVAVLIGLGTWLSSQDNTITQTINNNDGN